MYLRYKFVFGGIILSEILLISSDGLSSPSIKLKHQCQGNLKEAYSWGFGWYPNDKLAAIIAKDPDSKNSEVLTNALTEWSSFRSSVFLSKVKESSKGYSHHETQPFSRSFAGRDWLFSHNGTLDKTKMEKLFTKRSRFLEPLGKTDSELAFCFLMSKILENDFGKLSEIPNTTLQDWFLQLDRLGGFDILLSDGSTTVCYHGSTSPERLFYSRLQPPEHPTYFESDSAWFDLSDPRDIHRTYFIVSSSQFHSGNWYQIQPRQLLIIRKGTLIWDSSSNQSHIAPEVEMYSKNPIKRLLKNFTSVNPGQSQSHQSVVNARSITHTSRGKPLTYRMFEISHTTHYSYAQAVEHSTHVFRLQPMEDPTQEVISSNFSVSTQGEEIRHEDVFGNQTINYTIDTPYTELSIQCVSRVKIYATPPVNMSLSLRKSSMPLVWMPWQRQMLLPYRQPTELPETQLRELTQYAMSFVERNDSHPMNTLKDMNLTI
ncbi:MAG: putative glutamine amidotransferase, partial [Francisellaceae bacterium]